jgi:serine/threonine protein kinase
MAREIFAGQGYTNKVDVWSFAMVKYLFCTGLRPYEEFANGNEAEFGIWVVKQLKKGGFASHLTIAIGFSNHFLIGVWPNIRMSARR